LTRKIRIHALAESDLIAIWEYTFREWGVDQADKYLDELDDGIRHLVDDPEIGVNRDYARAGYRVLFINEHAVYYTFDPSAIHVIRVLHGQMDPSRHL
jgi:toxin ParE1/3/4